MKKGEKPPRYGKRLKYFRIARGVTIKELAEATNLSPSFISLIENDKTDASFSNMQKILRYLNMTLAEEKSSRISSKVSSK